MHPMALFKTKSGRRKSCHEGQVPPPCFDRALWLARPPLHPKRSAYGLAGLRSGRASQSVGWQPKPRSRIRADLSRWNWLAGKGALYRETLQATGRTTRILNRPKRVYADACHANSENQLASGSQKEPSFFSERNCDISVLSHQRGSPQVMTIFGSEPGLWGSRYGSLQPLKGDEAGSRRLGRTPV
jgi:hypothetical protein